MVRVEKKGETCLLRMNVCPLSWAERWETADGNVHLDKLARDVQLRDIFLNGLFNFRSASQR